MFRLWSKDIVLELINQMDDREVWLKSTPRREEFQ